MITKDLGLADLVRIEDWQKIQDQFSEALEISLQTINPNGSPFTRASRPNRLCNEIIPRLKNIPDNCRGCIFSCEARHDSQAMEKGKRSHCPFGLEPALVPITPIKDRIIACMVVGPAVLTARRSPSEYEREAKKLGVNYEDLMDALIEINVFSYSKMSSILSILKDVFMHMAQAGYHKKRLGEMAPDLMELDPIFSRYYEEKILNSLLKSCAFVLNADSGSVMTMDRETKTLHIKASSKLSEDVVNNTNIKVGEGIAGLAVAKAEPIILPKDGYKEGLNGKMNRKEIGSSLIVPIGKGSEHGVYGVINLNILRKGVEFSDRDVQLVKEIVKMAGIALIPIWRSIQASSGATEASSR